MFRSVLYYAVKYTAHSLQPTQRSLNNYSTRLAWCYPRNHGSFEQIIAELGWTTLSERRKFVKPNLVYEIVHGLSPIYSQFHLDLRNADHLTVPRCRLRKTECSFRVSSIILWNSLPCSTRNYQTIESFKCNYKKIMFPN
jgi:hypothetical protein